MIGRGVGGPQTVGDPFVSGSGLDIAQFSGSCRGAGVGRARISRAGVGRAGIGGAGICCTRICCTRIGCAGIGRAGVGCTRVAGIGRVDCARRSESNEYVNQASGHQPRKQGFGSRHLNFSFFAQRVFRPGMAAIGRHMAPEAGTYVHNILMVVHIEVSSSHIFVII